MVCRPYLSNKNRHRKERIKINIFRMFLFLTFNRIQLTPEVFSITLNIVVPFLWNLHYH